MTQTVRDLQAQEVFEFGFDAQTHPEQIKNLMTLFSQVLQTPLDSEQVRILADYMKHQEYLSSNDIDPICRSIFEETTTLQEKDQPNITEIPDALEEVDHIILSLGICIIKDTLGRWFPKIKDEFDTMNQRELLDYMSWPTMCTSVSMGLAALIELTLMDYGKDLKDSRALSSIPNGERRFYYALNLAIIFTRRMELLAKK